MEKIEADYKTAFKAGHRPKVEMLRMLKSAIKNAEIEARHNLTDDEIITVMTREAKRRRESIQMFQHAGRSDLVDKENAELQELMFYLPTQFSDSEIEAVGLEVIAELKATAKDFGRVMGAVMKKVKGQAEGERVSTAVKKLLK
jgi:uncharacterized protein YqeY